MDTMGDIFHLEQETIPSQQELTRHKRPFQDPPAEHNDDVPTWDTQALAGPHEL